MVLLAAAAPSVPGWPHFRGDPTQQGVAPTELPAALAELWAFQAGDEIRSSPVVAGGLVVFGAGDGALYALNAAVGGLAWRVAVGAPIEAPATVIGDLVVVGDLDGVVHAVALATGAPRWTRRTGDKIMGAPNHAGGTVVVGSYDGSLYGLERATGETRWVYPTSNFLHSSPAVSGRSPVVEGGADVAMVGGCDGNLHIVSLASGEGVRQIEIGAQIGSSIVVDDAGETAWLGHYGNQFIAVDTRSSVTLWRYQDRAFPYFSSAALRGDLLVFGGRDKRLHAVHAATGALRWTYRTRGQVDGSPVLAGDKVVVASEDGRLHLLEAATGRLLWTYDLGAEVQGSVAVAEGRVYLGASDGRLRAFGAAPR